MATPRVLVSLPAGSNWTSIEGTAAGVAGVTWQNVGGCTIQIAFTTAAPAGGAADAYHVLPTNSAFYDANGSAKVWARCIDGQGSTVSATSD